MMGKRSTTAVSPRSSLSTRIDPDAFTQLASTAVRGLTQAAGRGEVSRRKIARRASALHEVAHLAGVMAEIVEHDHAIARASAACLRDLAHVDTEIAQCQATQAQHEAQRAEFAAHARNAPRAIAEELRLREETAGLAADQLRLRRDELQRQRTAASLAAPPHAASTGERASASAFDLAELQKEAARIVREVRSGSVPTGPRFPYHAFTGCAYLQARIDGATAGEAATIARDELVEQMLTGSSFTPTQITGFSREHHNLKKRLEDAADTRRTTSILASLHAIGRPAPAPTNGEGVQ